MSFSSSYLDGIECQSRCELEVDAVATDVLNREEVTDNIGGNPGLAALWEDERQRRIQEGKSTDDLEPPSSPGKIYILYFSTAVQIAKVAQPMLFIRASHLG